MASGNAKESVSNLHVDTENDGRNNNDIDNSVFEHVESVRLGGYGEDLGYQSDTRFKCCCKYHNQRVSDVTACVCHPDTVNYTTEILSDTQTVSAEPINLRHSNQSRTKPISTPIFAISSDTRPNTPDRHQKFTCEYTSQESRTPSRITTGLQKCFHRRTMLKLVCYSVIVLILCTCGGVVMLNHSPDGASVHHHSDRVHTRPKSGLYHGLSGNSEESNIFMNLPYKTVPLTEFKKRLATTSRLSDIMRIFFEKSNLSDDQVNSLVYMKSHSNLYGKRDSHSRGVMGEMAGIDGDAGNAEKWVEHIKEFNNSPFSKCSVPKPELLRVDELGDQDSLLTYFPSCTIVHRCRSETGCCPQGYECKPRQENGIEIIDRHFMVLKRTFDENGEAVIPIQKLFAAKSFINHTACECQSVEFHSNCNKKCPRQFRKNRESVDCDCICQNSNRKCRSIRRGIHPLDETDLECIKKDECIVPQCKSGTFNIATGFCPHFRRHKRQKNG